MREEKRRKEEEEKEARKRAEEEERRRREEEEEARRRAEEEERKRLEEAAAAARRKAEEEEEAARRAEEEEAAKKKEATEQAREPQTREDPDIELVTEETLDHNLPVLETEEEAEAAPSSHTEEELDDGELDPETNGSLDEAGAQLEEREEEEELDTQTTEASSEGVSAEALTPSAEDQPPSDSSTPSAGLKRVRPAALNKGPSSRSQEKREQRRRRGLEHNQRATERAGSQEASKKELDQYTFVAWKMKEEKPGSKKEVKEVKTSPLPTGPVRPSTLPLQPLEAPEKNGMAEAAGAVQLQRRPGAIKEKPEKWRERRSDGDLWEGHVKEEPRKTYSLYVCCSDH